MQMKGILFLSSAFSILQYPLLRCPSHTPFAASRISCCFCPFYVLFHCVWTKWAVRFSYLWAKKWLDFTVRKKKRKTFRMPEYRATYPHDFVLSLSLSLWDDLWVGCITAVSEVATVADCIVTTNTPQTQCAMWLNKCRWWSWKEKSNYCVRWRAQLAPWQFRGCSCVCRRTCDFALNTQATREKKSFSNI